VGWEVVGFAGRCRGLVDLIDGAARLLALDGEAEALADFARGGGLVERVEMDAGDAVVEEVGALLGGVVEADFADGFGGAVGALEGFEELGGEAAAAGEFGHAFHRAEAGDGHDAGDDGGGDSGEGATVAEVVEIVVVEEKLGADVVGTGVYFGFEVLHFKEAVGRGGVTFGKAGDANAEAAGIGMAAEFFDEGDEGGGLGKNVARVVVIGLVAWRVTAEGEDVADPGGGVAFEDGGDFGFVVADASEVGNGVERGGGFEPEDEVVGEFARGAPRAVGDADKVGLDFFEVADGGVELLLGLRGFRREELEGDGGLAGLKDVADVHGGEF